MDWDSYHGLPAKRRPSSWEEYHGIAAPPAERPSPYDEPDCTGIAASWCPRCGDCACGLERREAGDLNAPDCSLHAADSDHCDLGLWTGPRESDWADRARGIIRRRVPGDRWPYGPPRFHEDCCLLHEGGGVCDCKASDASDTRWGVLHR